MFADFSVDLSKIATSMQPPPYPHPNVAPMLNLDIQRKVLMSTRLCCTKCRFATKDQELFERHIAQHEGLTFTCNICGHVSYSKVESQRHAVQHSGKFPFRCSFCNYGAVRRDYILKHVSRVHGKMLNVIPSLVSPQNVLIKGDGLLSPVQNVLTGVLASTADSSGLPPNPLPVEQWNITTDSGVQRQHVGFSSNRDFPNLNSNPPSQRNQLISVPSVVTKPVGHPYVSVRIPSDTGNASSSLNHSARSGPNKDVFPGQPSHLANPSVQSADGNLKRRPLPIILRRSKQGQTVLPPSSNVLKGNKPVTPAAKMPATLNHPPPYPNVVAVNTNQAAKEKIQRTSGPISKSGSSSSFRSSIIPSGGGPTILSTLNVIPASGEQTVMASIPNANVTNRVVLLPTTRPTVHNNGRLGNLRSQPQTARVMEQSLPKTSAIPQHASAPLGKQYHTVRQQPRLVSPLNVELLEPVSQPLSHNHTLTVSYPDRLNITPGSLVELVKVKNVNGGQELQLRVVSKGTGCSDKGVSVSKETARGPTLKVGGAGQSGSVLTDKASFGTHSGVEATQSATCSDTRSLKVSSKPSIDLCTQTKIKVEVKEEPLDKDSCSIVCPNVSKLGPGNPVEGLSNAGFSDGMKELLQILQSPPKPHSPNGLSIPTKDSQPPGVTQDKKTTTLKMVKQCSSHQSTEDVEGLPVILAVYSLDKIPESKTFPNLLDSGTPRGYRTVAHQINTASDDCNQNIFESTQVSKEPKNQYFKKHEVVPHNKKCLGHGNCVIEQQNLNSSIPVLAELTNPVNVSSVRKSNKLSPLRREDCLISSVKRKAWSGVHLNDIGTESYEQLFTLVPKVSLLRITNKHLQAAWSETAADNWSGEGISKQKTLMCFSSNKQISSITDQQPHELLKLRLKRKKCGNENETDVFEALPLPHNNNNNYDNAEAMDLCESGESNKSTVKRLKLFGTAVQRLHLMPVKDSQSVKYPGPNQPVVVLNPPYPLRKCSWSPTEAMGIAPLRIALSGDVHKIIPEIVKAPALKMTFKKVQGNKYQVTELLAEGLSDNMGP